MCLENDIETQNFSWSELWAEILGLGAAVIIPLALLVFDLAEQKPDLFPRGGAICLFIFVALQLKALLDAEFVTRHGNILPERSGVELSFCRHPRYQGRIL